jgi:hypothetical protein
MKKRYDISWAVLFCLQTVFPWKHKTYEKEIVLFYNIYSGSDERHPFTNQRMYILKAEGVRRGDFDHITESFFPCATRLAHPRDEAKQAI